MDDVDRVENSPLVASACDAGHGWVVLCWALLPAEGVRKEVMTMKCTICGHPGSHAVLLDPPDQPLPTRCLTQCARCRQEAAAEQQED